MAAVAFDLSRIRASIVAAADAAPAPATLSPAGRQGGPGDAVPGAGPARDLAGKGPRAAAFPDSRHPRLPVVSGHTGAGVHAVWKGIVDCAAKASVKEGVPVHVSTRK
jgi:hypothetical protein